MAAPPWLQDEPEIRALLAAVLDRFDQQPGDTRERAIVVPAARHLASLTKGDAQADQTWEFVHELERGGVLLIRHGRRSAYDPQWHNAKLAIPPASEATLREWLERPATAAPMLQWRRAVELHAQRFPGGHEALLPRRIIVPGRSAEEVVAALARLAEINSAATLRQLSTHAFWGDSKVLDDRADLVAALFPGLQIRERPIVVAVHLPIVIRGVLFIENQDTYTCAIGGQPPATADHALIYMAGFRGAAARIRMRDGACLHFGGPGIASRSSEFERWWFDAAAFAGEAEASEASFWGDLDFAGMQILKSLRSRFGAVTAWRTGYEPMLDDLRRSGASPLWDSELSARDFLRSQKQVDPGATGCSYADAQLLPAIREYGFWHQERITP
jgi:hypothetical protein